MKTLKRSIEENAIFRRSFVAEDEITGFWFYFEWCPGLEGFKKHGPYRDETDAKYDMKIVENL